MGMIDDIAFWQTVIAESKRMIVCSPEMESRIKTIATLMGSNAEIVVSRSCPDDKLYVLDDNAMQAAINEQAQRGFGVGR